MPLTAEKKSIDANTLLAWAGWSLNVPQDWRPWRVEGDGAQGHVLLGHASAPTMQVKWIRIEPERFSWKRWQASRVRSRTLEPTRSRLQRGLFDGDAQFFDQKTGRRLTLCYSAESRLALEVVEMEAADTIVSLRTADDFLSGRAGSQPARIWSVFGCQYAIPRNFCLHRYQLNLGHQALEFRRDSDRLILEQIYPARLALARRSMDDWLRLSAFKDRRVVTDIRRARMDDAIEIQESIRRLRLPLGKVRPRQNLRIALHAVDSDRLLIAELDSHSSPDRTLLDECLTGMQPASEAAS